MSAEPAWSASPAARIPARTRVMLRILASHNMTASSRELAANLLAASGDRAATPQLANTLHTLVSQSEADLALEGVAVAALQRPGAPRGPGRPLGRRRARRRHPPPLPSPGPRRAGRPCDPGVGRATLQTFASDRDPSLSTSAQAAAKRCYK